MSQELGKTSLKCAVLCWVGRNNSVRWWWTNLCSLLSVCHACLQWMVFTNMWEVAIVRYIAGIYTTTILRPFVWDYPGEPVPEETPTHHPDHHPIFICFFRLPRSIASSLFKLRAWQSFCTTSFHVFFGLPLGLEPSTSYSIHFFTQSVSSFCSTCPYHRNLLCCSINIISSISSLSLNSLLGTPVFLP